MTRSEFLRKAILSAAILAVGKKSLEHYQYPTFGELQPRVNLFESNPVSVTRRWFKIKNEVLGNPDLFLRKVMYEGIPDVEPSMIEVGTMDDDFATGHHTVILTYSNL